MTQNILPLYTKKKCNSFVVALLPICTTVTLYQVGPSQCLETFLIISEHEIFFVWKLKLHFLFRI